MEPELKVGYALILVSSPFLYPLGEYVAKGPQYLAQKLRPNDLKAQAQAEVLLSLPMLLPWGLLLIRLLANLETTTTILTSPVSCLLAGNVRTTYYSVRKKWRTNPAQSAKLEG